MAVGEGVPTLAEFGAENQTMSHRITEEVP
jgi:hypothetical protein